MQKHLGILRHSLTMVGRTLRSYILLSVTIVLSFSLLLGYLGFVDSEIYNEYKHIFQINRGILKVNDGLGNTAKFDALLEKVSVMDDTSFYTVYDAWVHMSDSKFTTDDGITLPPRQIAVFYLSGHVWEFIRHTGEKYNLQWIDGQEHDGVDLRQGEAVLDLATFCALGLNEMDEPVYTFRFTAGVDDYLETTVKIVGTIDLGGSFFKETTDGLGYNDDYSPMILLPMTGVTYKDIAGLHPGRYAVFYSENPEKVYQLATDIGFELALSDSVGRMRCGRPS